MPNIFDQFDEPRKDNVFDQFDTQPEVPVQKPDLDFQSMTKAILDRYQAGDYSPDQIKAFDELKRRGTFEMPMSVDALGAGQPEEMESIVSHEQDFIKPMTMKNMISQAIKNTPVSAKQFISDIITPLMHPVETKKALATLSEGLINKLIPGKQEDEQIVDDLVEVFKDRYGGMENIKKTLAKDPVGFVADVSSLLVPGGAAVKTTGALSKSEKISGLGKIISKTGETLEPVTAATKAVKKVVSKVIPKELPSDLYQSAAKFSTVIPENVRSGLTKTALENRIMPTVQGLDSLREKINVINDEITKKINMATDQGKKIPLGALFTKLKELRKDALLSGEPIAQRRAIDNIAKQISIANRKIGRKEFTPAEVQKLKQNIYKETESLYSKASQKPIKGEAKQAIAKAAKESLEDLFPEIKNLNKNEGSLIALRKELEKSASRISNRDLLGIGVPIKGGAGGAIGGVPGLLGGAVIGLFDTPKVKAKLAIVMNSLKKKGVIFADDSLMKQILELAPGATPVALRQAGKLEQQDQK
jgi:hypothetical protein